MAEEIRKGARLAALAAMADALLSVEPHGWLGRTHLQKAVYFAQELMGLDLGYEFTIYQYGPYASSLDSDVHELQIMRALSLQMVGGYPDYQRGPNIGPLLEYAKTGPVAGKGDTLKKLAEIVSPRKARDLELLTTILFLGRQQYRGRELISAVQRLKPHFSQEQVEHGVAELTEVSHRLAHP